MTLHPIDWLTFYGSFSDIFAGLRNAHMITDSECAILSADNPTSKCTFKYSGVTVEVLLDNPYNLKGTVSLFMLLSAVRFKHDEQHTLSYIKHELMKEPIPYIRVGVNYFKIIHKETRYGGSHTNIKHWTKEEIKSDHSKTFLSQIPRFDDFTIVPDNKNYQPVIGNCYNLYSAFSHAPHPLPVTESDIPHTTNFLRHIFGEHYSLGLEYFKILYEHPKQILPILCLVSAKNETGKTTFINFIEMIFGGNYVLISPDDLTRNFNNNYATKNIISIEETFVEKQAGVEKLKSLSTGKSIQVSRKFVDEHALPFFGKLILNTNKVKDFMRVSSEEIRFWIREIPKIEGKKNVNIENDLFEEIPKFIRFISDLPTINFNTGSRMYFTAEQIQTAALRDLKNESQSGLYKEIEILIEDFYNNSPLPEFKATAKDIKEYWFARDNKISIAYIRKVLTDEVGMVHSNKSIRYHPLGDTTKPTVVGLPFTFVNPNPITPETLAF